MDAIQQGHIARTRTLLEESSIGHETKESMHDCLTAAAQAANGCPPEQRQKYEAAAMLALSNVMVRMAVATPTMISNGINQHMVSCPQVQKSKPAISWESKGFLPAGSIKGGYAVMLSIVLAMCVVGYGAHLYFNYKTIVSDAFATQQSASVLAKKTARTVSDQAGEQQAMERRIAALIISEMSKKPN